LYSGESGLGKSTLINTLFNTTLYPEKQPLPPSAEHPNTVAIESISAGMHHYYFTVTLLMNHLISDIEENGVRLRLTVVDTPGFGDFVNNDNRFINQPIVYFCRSQCSAQLMTLQLFAAGNQLSKTSRRASMLTLSKKTA
jgi:septin 7